MNTMQICVGIWSSESVLVLFGPILVKYSLHKDSLFGNKWFALFRQTSGVASLPAVVDVQINISS